MNPSSNSGPRTALELFLLQRGVWPRPCDAVVESWFGAASDVTPHPLRALLRMYRDGHLRSMHRRRVEARLRTDPKLRALLAQYDRAVDAADGEEDELVWRHAGGPWKEILATTQPDLEGIEVPSLSQDCRRRGPRLRMAPRKWQSTPVGPCEFVQRLLDELGTFSGIELVDHAFRVVAATGEPDPWISAVGRARDRGAMDSALAHFLIWQFAVSALRRLSETDPVLSALNAQIEHIERRYDLEELDTWFDYAGPPKWEALCQDWNAAHDALVMRILTRNEEYEVLRDFQRGQKPYAEGRIRIYGV